MSHHVLFCVHGMGESDPQAWTDGIEAKLKAVAKRYWTDEQIAESLDRDVTFIPAGYGDSVSERVALWRAAAGDGGEFAKLNNIESPDVLGWISELGDAKREFFWSHVSYVVLYRFFGLYRERLRLRVIRQLVEGFNKTHARIGGEEECYYSVLAHSLGTSVAHDCLQEIGSRNEWIHPDTGKEMVNAFQANDQRFDTLFMISNVSRLLETTSNAHESMVRPSSEGNEDTVCDVYRNIRHQLDPISMPRRFNPVKWSVQPIPAEVNHIHDWNVHGIEHYLDHPKVHIPILRTLSENYPIPGSVFRKALRDYDQVELDILDDEQEEAFRRSLQILVDKLELADEPKEYLDGFIEVFALMTQVKALLTGGGR